MSSMDRELNSGNIVYVNDVLVAGYIHHQLVSAASSAEADYDFISEACKDGPHQVSFPYGVSARAQTHCI